MSQPDPPQQCPISLDPIRIPFGLEGTVFDLESILGVVLVSGLAAKHPLTRNPFRPEDFSRLYAVASRDPESAKRLAELDPPVNDEDGFFRHLRGVAVEQREEGLSASLTQAYDTRYAILLDRVVFEGFERVSAEDFVEIYRAILALNANNFNAASEYMMAGINRRIDDLVMSGSVDDEHGYPALQRLDRLRVFLNRIRTDMEIATEQQQHAHHFHPSMFFVASSAPVSSSSSTSHTTTSALMLQLLRILESGIREAEEDEDDEQEGEVGEAGEAGEEAGGASGAGGAADMDDEDNGHAESSSSGHSLPFLVEWFDWVRGVKGRHEPDPSIASRIDQAVIVVTIAETTRTSQGSIRPRFVAGLAKAAELLLGPEFVAAVGEDEDLRMKIEACTWKTVEKAMVSHVMDGRLPPNLIQRIMNSDLLRPDLRTDSPAQNVLFHALELRISTIIPPLLEGMRELKTPSFRPTLAHIRDYIDRNSSAVTRSHFWDQVRQIVQEFTSVS